MSLTMVVTVDAASYTIVDSLGGAGTVTRWLLAGLPVAALPDGTVEIPASLADRLRAGTALSPETALLAAPLFVAGGQTRAAIAALFAAGEDAAVARMLTSLGRARLDDLTHPELLATTGRLAAAGAADARTRMIEARLLRELGRIDDQRHALELASLAAPADDAALRRSIEAEQVAADLANGPTPERMAALDDLECRTPASEMWSRATITTARAHALGWTNDARSQAESDLLFRQVTALWAGLGDPLAQADALRGWAVFVLMPGARYDAALRALRDAVSLSGSAAFSRAQSLVFLAQVVALLGDRDGARSTIAEARRLGQTAGIAWVSAYASWAEIYVALLDDDAAAIHHHSATALGQLGQLENHPTQTIVLAETARALAQVGDVDGAVRHLALISDDPTDPSESRALAQLTYDAMHGDASAAMALAERISTTRLLAPGQQWRIELLRALALARAGRQAEARAANALAERVADDWGVGHLPDVMEPRVRERARRNRLSRSRRARPPVISRVAPRERSPSSTVPQRYRLRVAPVGHQQQQAPRRQRHQGSSSSNFPLCSVVRGTVRRGRTGRVPEERRRA